MFGLDPNQYSEAMRQANEEWAERQANRMKSEALPAGWWERFSVHEWIHIMQDLGWWDSDVTEEEFWEKATSWWRSYQDLQSDSPSPSA